MCLHYTMVSQAIVLLTITMLPNLHKIVDEFLDNFIHYPFAEVCIYSFTVNVTYFEHAKTLKSLSKVIFVSGLVGAQISRESCNLDKARGGIRSPAPVWSWLGHGEPPVQVITDCCLCNSSAWCTSTTVNILPINLVSTCFDISQSLPLEKKKKN